MEQDDKFQFAGEFGSIVSYGRINYKNSHSSANCCGCSLPYEHRPLCGSLFGCVSELDEAGRRAHRVAERPLLFSAVGTDLAAGLELVDEGLGAHDVHIRLAHVAAVPAKDHVGRKAVIDAAGAFFLFLGGQRPGIDVLIDCHRLLIPCQIWCSRLTLS